MGKAHAALAKWEMACACWATSQALDFDEELVLPQKEAAAQVVRAATCKAAVSFDQAAAGPQDGPGPGAAEAAALADASAEAAAAEAAEAEARHQCTVTSSHPMALS